MYWVIVMNEYFDVVSLHFDRFILFCCLLSISVARRLSEERDSGFNIWVGFMDLGIGNGELKKLYIVYSEVSILCVVERWSP